MGTQRKGAPICPGCGAKFAHDKGRAACSKCGLPDEIASMGPLIIARWKRKELGKRNLKQRHPARKRKAHGRP